MVTTLAHNPVFTFLTERKKIAALLAEVPDPEIPNVSIVDLGMIINIDKVDDNWLIELAPTYSGCPAIDVIPIMVETRLNEAGYENIRTKMQLSPPWSTDWISESGKKSLFEFGISPPHRIDHYVDVDGKPRCCPQCGSVDTQLVSRFSSTPCKAAYKCNTCLEPFEYFKCY